MHCRVYVLIAFCLEWCLDILIFFLETQQKFASAKCDIWWRQSVAVNIKPILESIWIVQPHKINILIEFSFIYYFFNCAKLKMNNCKLYAGFTPPGKTVCWLQTSLAARIWVTSARTDFFTNLCHFILNFELLFR